MNEQENQHRAILANISEEADQNQKPELCLVPADETSLDRNSRDKTKIRPVCLGENRKNSGTLRLIARTHERENGLVIRTAADLRTK
jgi:hypothetical protein